MKQISVVRAVLKRRGYLVLWQAPWHSPLSIGQVVDKIGAEGFDLGNFAVRSRTNKADFLTQQILSRKIEPSHWRNCSPTRQVSEHVKECRPAKPLYWRVTPTRKALEKSTPRPACEA